MYVPFIWNFSEICTCNNTAPRRPIYGMAAYRGPIDFHMALAYFCDISSLLCNKVCVQVKKSAVYWILIARILKL